MDYVLLHDLIEIVISGDHNEPIKRREFNRLFHLAGQTTMRCVAMQLFLL
jgi:hypothetical protein